MFHHIKLSAQQQIQSFKKSFLQFPELPFSEVLSTNSLQQFIVNSSDKDAPEKRQRIFTPLVTLKAFVSQVLSADGSCRQAVSQVLSERISKGKNANSINTSSYCKARKKLPLKALVNAVNDTGKALHNQTPLNWRWKGHNTLVVDGTTLLMPDTKSNQDAYPQQASQKPGLGFPITRLVGLISLSTGTVISYANGVYQGKQTGETSLFSRLFDDIDANDILLADCYYCTWAITALLLQQGSYQLTPNHAKRKTNFLDGEILGAKDHIIHWKKPKQKPVWMTEDAYQALPEFIRIREFSVAGQVYVTTLLDCKAYHKKELAILYKTRWTIELDFRTIKTNMGMDMLRCKTADMVRKEIAVHFFSYNLIRTNMASAAQKYKKNPRQLSFMTALQIFNEIKFQLVLQTGDLLRHIINRSLEAMTKIGIGKQKRKNQPRAKKRRPKPYPLLTIPRKEACKALN